MGHGKDERIYHRRRHLERHLDIRRLPDGMHWRYRNNRAGHHAPVKWLRAAPVERVVYEATGPHHRAFELVLGTAGLT